MPLEGLGRRVLLLEPIKALLQSLLGCSKSDARRFGFKWVAVGEALS